MSILTIEYYFNYYDIYKRIIYSIYLIAAGHLPLPANGQLITGKVGTDLTTEQGYDAAKIVGLNILATLKGMYNI